MLTEGQSKALIKLLNDSDPWETVRFGNKLLEILGYQSRIKWEEGYFGKETPQGWGDWHDHKFMITNVDIRKDPH